jgi:type 1 glutamine amidotransferase/lysophospholipase L1-like esterase
MTEFKKHLEANYRIECTTSFYEGTGSPSKLDNLDGLKSADVLVLFARRMNLREEQMKLIRAHWDQGKPIVGIRTASHAFQKADNEIIDRKLFGGNYGGASSNGGFKTAVAKGQEEHPILKGVGEIKAAKYAYGNGPLADGVVVLHIVGRIKDKDFPVTWVNTHKGARYFYTSLGAPEDFQQDALKRLLSNAIFWTAKRDPAVKKPPVEKTVLPESWDYAGPMKKVAARFRGNEGVVLHVGGSMTIANPYGTWARSGKGKTDADLAILKWMHTDTKDKRDGWWLCRTEVVNYRAYTAESGLKSAMLHEGGKRGLPTLAKMLDDYQPRMVTIECGIYDVEDGVALDDYRKNMARALDLILDRGAIPVLNTIPPFKAQLERTKQFNDALRDIARERGIPVLDLEREIFTRRPDDWFGTLMDRIHLTAAQKGGNPAAEPTAENLKKSGYHLRGWLTVQKIAEIKRSVLD